MARRVGPSDLPVLITGETGSGKEIIAREVHDASPRAGKSFGVLVCSAVPREMLDSHLFGHRRGAFTGAIDSFLGVIRANEGGTLFLDEIGEVSLDLQVKLLRFLETGEVHPLGETKPVKVDVRVIAATNQPLEALIKEGRFREDLFYRLNVVRITDSAAAGAPRRDPAVLRALPDAGVRADRPAGPEPVRRGRRASPALQVAGERAPAPQRGEARARHASRRRGNHAGARCPRTSPRSARRRSPRRSRRRRTRCSCGPTSRWRRPSKRSNGPC